MLRNKDYYQLLNDKEKADYKEKYRFINFIDPYLIKKNDFTSDCDMWPPLNNLDIVNHLVFSPSLHCSMDEMRAYKGLEAHNQFVSGFVREVEVADFDDIYIIRGRCNITPTCCVSEACL